MKDRKERTDRQKGKKTDSQRRGLHILKYNYQNRLEKLDR